MPKRIQRSRAKGWLDWIFGPRCEFCATRTRDPCGSEGEAKRCPYLCHADVLLELANRDG